MSEGFEKRLNFESDTFEDMKNDMDFVLQRLIGNMQEKGTNEGSMTLKIDVTMVKEFIPNYDPEIKGETREVSKPQFKHKVTSAVKINDEKSGALNNEMELVMDKETGIFKLVPIANTVQRSIFDSDFQQKDGEKCVNAEEGENGQNVIEGSDRYLLTGPAEEDGRESDSEEVETEVIDFEISFDEYIQEGELEDITDELLGTEQEDDGYGYDEPEDDYDE